MPKVADLMSGIELLDGPACHVTRGGELLFGLSDRPKNEQRENCVLRENLPFDLGEACFKLFQTSSPAGLDNRRIAGGRGAGNASSASVSLKHPHPTPLTGPTSLRVSC